MNKLKVFLTQVALPVKSPYGVGNWYKTSAVENTT
jgi:hypothetical protein